jgi:hypothetical protein
MRPHLPGLFVVIIAVFIVAGAVGRSIPGSEHERVWRAVDRYGFVDPLVGGWHHAACANRHDCTAFSAVSPIDHQLLSGYVVCLTSDWKRDPADCIVHVDSRPFRPPQALERSDHR